MTEPAEAANPPSAPKRALLAWEFGSGRTHIANLLGVAARLRGAGVECVAALYDMRFADEFAALGVAAVQNYVWPARRRAPFGWQEQEVRTVGDALANLGFADPPSLRAALDHYDGLFALFRPDVVLCENAFGGVLAARNRRPVIAFGTGSCLPPIDGPGFPLREGYQGQPGWPEDFVTGRINEALASRGREPLRHLSDLFGIEGVHPFGPLEFDLYAAKRRAPMLPPHLPAIERPLPSGPSDEIFVYLHGFVQANEKVMAGLRAIDRPMRLYMPELVPDQRDRFPASCRIESQAVPPADIVRRARCVIHHGGPQLTTLCLVAGKPQIILAKELDNELCARFIQARGLGAARHITQAATEWIITAGRRAFEDAEVRHRCAAAAPEFAAWLDGDPTRTVADAALELIGRRQLPA